MPWPSRRTLKDGIPIHRMSCSWLFCRHRRCPLLSGRYDVEAVFASSPPNCSSVTKVELPVIQVLQTLAEKMGRGLVAAVGRPAVAGRL